MDLLEVLGLSRPTAENALCLEIYDESMLSEATHAGESSEAVESIRGKCMQLIAPYVEGYIWQHEPLRLQCSTKQQPPWLIKTRGKARAQEQQQHTSNSSSSSEGPPFVWGVLCYEDNVEDEWWVVWLLLQCSRQIPSLAARVWDDDGDFLLIEAAYALPRWLKPETSTNRVWLRQGQVHIIPPQAPSSQTCLSVLLLEMLLRYSAVEASRRIMRGKLEGSILRRLAGYPQKAKQQQQRVTVWVPRRLGLLLQQDPQLAAAAVEAFMTRQREDVQAAAKQSAFPPTDMTTALVTLNRCMYAQLMQSDFAAPKTYPKPPTTPAWLSGDANRQTKAFNMGLKLTTGMEIMAVRLGVTGSSSNSSSGSSAAAAAGMDSQQQQQQQVLPLSANPAWRQYLASLTASGYFDGELQGSARYRQLLAAAQGAFTASPAYAASCEAAAAPARHLQLLLTRVDAQQQQCSAHNGVLHNSSKDTDTTTCSTSSSSSVGDGVSGNGAGFSSTGQLPPLHPAAAVLDADSLSEDSDSWMSEDTARAEQIVTELEAQAAADEAKKREKRSRKIAAAAAAGAAAATGGQQQDVEVDAEELLAGFKGFVKAMVSHEGAEVPDSSSKKAAAAQQQQQQQRGVAAAAATPGIDFNTDVFLRELMDLLGSAAEADARGSSSSKHELPQQQQQQASDADALLSQLQSLQQQLECCLCDDTSGSAAAGAAAALQNFTQHSGREVGRDQEALQGYTSDEDDYGTSSSEGSSFYGSDQGCDSDDEEDGAGDGEQQRVGSPVQLPVPSPVSGRQQQQQDKQQQQQQWQLPPSFQAAMEQQQQQQQLQQRQLPPKLKKLQDSWEVMTATDSDDEYNSEDSEDALSLGREENGTSSEDGSDTEAEQPSASDMAAAAAAAKARGSGGFHDAYSAAMDAELAGTTMVQSFERVQVPGRHQQQQQQQHGQQASSSGMAAAAAAAAGGAGAAAEATAELAPVDVDINLIKSLVQSFTAQGGMPGPASNLAGLLGLQLPTEILEEK